MLRAIRRLKRVREAESRVERQHRHRVRSPDAGGERRDAGAQHVHPGVVLRHHRPGRDRVQHHRATVLGGTAQLQHPRPQPAHGAQLGDGRELLVAGREPELHQLPGLVDLDPGLRERAQVVRPDREHVAELLHVGGTEVVHRGAVDHQRAAAELPGQLRRHGGRGASVGDRLETTQARSDRVDAQVRSGSESGPLGQSPGHLGERPRSTELVRGRVQDHGRHVEQHALEHGRQVGDAHAGGADLHEQRGGTVLEVRQGGLRGSGGVRVGQHRTDVPTVPTRRWPDRVGKVRHEGPRAQRGHLDAVQGAMGELLPDGVVGIVIGQPTGLPQHGGRGLLPLRHVVVLPLGEREVGFRGHVRRIGTRIRCRPATVKYPT